ncbi:uncharacterized protein DMAD_11166 [Drosophila madeirensis]|uniref:Uncharacterized protein n=1 Tax=Drosophila madeirensis TaxID=30013 RepID=A0AAU9FC56_DROMD
MMSTIGAGAVRQYSCGVMSWLPRILWSSRRRIERVGHCMGAQKYDVWMLVTSSSFGCATGGIAGLLKLAVISSSSRFASHGSRSKCTPALVILKWIDT